MNGWAHYILYDLWQTLEPMDKPILREGYKGVNTHIINSENI